MTQIFHARDFHNRTLGREVAFEANHAAGRRERCRSLEHYILIGWEFHASQVFCDGLAGDGEAIAVQVTTFEQRFHHDRHTSDIE